MTDYFRAFWMVQGANARWSAFAGTWRDFIAAKSIMRVQDVYRLGGAQ